MKKLLNGEKTQVNVVSVLAENLIPYAMIQIGDVFSGVHIVIVTVLKLRKHHNFKRRGGSDTSRRIENRSERLGRVKMQTFLPYPSFLMSAKILDRQRLGKQRVEAKQIIEILEGKRSRWENHPCVNMWRGYVPALKEYFNTVSQEWIDRGFKHTIGLYDIRDMVLMPPWFGMRNFHRSHQSNLVRKKPEYYRNFFPKIRNDIPYEWNRDVWIEREG